MAYVLTHRVELNATATDYVSTNVGTNLPATSFAVSLWDQIGDRAFLGEPPGGQVWSQCSAAQVGIQHDRGFDAGQERIIVSDGVTTRVIRVSMDGGGPCHTMVCVTKSGSNYTVDVYKNGRLAGTDTSTYALGLTSGQTVLLLGVRSGPADHLNQGSFIRCSGVLSAVNAAGAAARYADGRPQDDSQTWDWDIHMGSGAGDTSSSFVDQSGNSRNGTMVGSWSTKGVTRHRPPRFMGKLFTRTGTSLTGWTAHGTGSISSGSTGVVLTTASTDYRACARYTAFPTMTPHWTARAVFSVATAGATVVSFAMTPSRANASAVAMILNLVNGAMTLHAGEWDSAFDTGTQVARSDSPANTGTVPISGGEDNMPLTGTANGDQFELILRLDGNTLSAWGRNLTRNLKPLRLVAVLDHTIVSGHRHTTPSPGYLAVGNLLNTSTIEILSLEMWSHTVIQPYCVYYTHSLANVDDEGTWTDGYVEKLNTLREAAGLGDKWIEVMGRPGARIDEFTDYDVLTGELEDQNPTFGASCKAANSLGALGDSQAQTDEQEFHDRAFDVWAIPPLHFRYICEPPMTLSGETTLAWRTNLTALAALRPSVISTSFAMHQGMGNPQGSNTQTAGDFTADNTHMAPVGMGRAAQFLHDGQALVFPEEIPVSRSEAGTLASAQSAAFAVPIAREESATISTVATPSVAATWARTESATLADASAISFGLSLAADESAIVSGVNSSSAAVASARAESLTVSSLQGWSRFVPASSVRTTRVGRE